MFAGFSYMIMQSTCNLKKARLNDNETDPALIETARAHPPPRRHARAHAIRRIFVRYLGILGRSWPL